jgi:hypothetical protein
MTLSLIPGRQLNEEGHECVVKALSQLGRVERHKSNEFMIHSSIECYGMMYSVCHAINYAQISREGTSRDLILLSHTITKLQEHTRPGWFCKSQAQLVAYFDVPKSICYLYSLHALREDEAKWRGEGRYIAYSRTDMRHTYYGYRLSPDDLLMYELARWPLEHPNRGAATIAFTLFLRTEFLKRNRA